MTNTWKDRVVSATRGNQTQLGTILLAALDRNVEGDFPQFGEHATVTSDGFITCNFIARDGRSHFGAFVGSVSDFTANLRALSKHLGLTKEEREELLDVALSWIKADYRSNVWRAS